MRLALSLARRALGRCWPNPAVGCVLVQAEPGGPGRIVGRGWTGDGGRPHAESEALARAGAAAQGATAYVSLEPCSHHGRTPPCADALVAAGITRAVVALRDPDPRVDGRGLAHLRRAGIAVDEGLCATEARAINAGFLQRVRARRPLVTLKVATTLDGRTATHRGHSQWITCEVARRWAHVLRARHDAIMVGSGTVLADDPMLDCRVPGLEPQSPVRVVVDRRLRLALTARLVVTARQRPTWLFTLPNGDRARQQALRDCGVEIIAKGWHAGNEMPELDGVLRALAERGITRLLVEGGSRLAAAFLRADLVDRIHWFRAASLIGGDGLAAVAAFGVDRLEQQPRYRRVAVRPLGDDALETYERLS